MGIGESAALTAAFFWAAASLIYGRIRLSAWGMNLCKNVLASVMLLLQLGIVALWYGSSVFSADSGAWFWLGLSGVIGIVLGDTCYLRCLQILGPRKALILSTTAPLFAAILGYLFLQEEITAIMVTGILLTSGSVIWVVAGQQNAEETPGLYPGSTASGVFCGIMGAICQALGAVCASNGLKSCDPIEGAFIRLFVSAILSFVIVFAMSELRSVVKTVAEPALQKKFVPAVIMGTWLGIWLSQIGYKYSTVSVTTTLLSTTPLFAIPLVRMFYGYRITATAVAGSLLAVYGVYLVVQQ